MENKRDDMSSSLRLLKQRMGASKAKASERAVTEADPESDPVVPQASSSAAATPVAPEEVPASTRPRTFFMPPAQSRHALRWTCKHCSKDCIPIRSESRCLCGHRYKEHEQGDHKHRCNARGCVCSSFFFIVAEGAWILRCECKHKHTDHDPRGPPYKCTKSRCSCTGFHSPWCCNCDHPWSEHQQEAYVRSSQGDAQLQDIMGDAIQRTDPTVPLPGFEKMQL